MPEVSANAPKVLSPLPKVIVPIVPSVPSVSNVPSVPNVPIKWFAKGH
jgi:hypothetical protein